MVRGTTERTWFTWVCENRPLLVMRIRRSVTTMLRYALEKMMIQIDTSAKYWLVVWAGITAWICSPGSKKGSAFARILSRIAKGIPLTLGSGESDVGPRPVVRIILPPPQISSRFVSRPRAATTALILAAVMAGCGSSGHSSATTVASTTTTVASTSTPSTTAGATSTSTTVPDLEGNEADRIPSVPAATEAPSLPNPTTEAGRRQFLTEVFTDLQQTWSHAFATAGVPYHAARLVFFTSNVTSACGPATSEVGPFYCPADQTVYLDTSFFDMMEERFGVTGDFAQAYVVAHEIGHHVQNQLGISSRVAAANQANPSLQNPLSVRVELQADCLAGVWAHSSYQRQLLSPGDLQDALNAAAAVGDDFLQHATGNMVTPESWTHGSSAQRQHWLTVGFDSGTASDCDTFTASI